MISEVLRNAGSLPGKGTVNVVCPICSPLHFSYPEQRGAGIFLTSLNRTGKLCGSNGVSGRNFSTVHCNIWCVRKELLKTLDNLKLATALSGGPSNLNFWNIFSRMEASCLSAQLSHLKDTWKTRNISIWMMQWDTSPENYLSSGILTWLELVGIVGLLEYC